MKEKKETEGGDGYLNRTGKEKKISRRKRKKLFLKNKEKTRKMNDRKK